MVEVIAPQVIDENLIRDCVGLGYVTDSMLQQQHQLQEKQQQSQQSQQQHLQLINNKNEPKEPVEFQEVTLLTFSFRNILKISNLRGFDSLVKLQLDNNIIERIEGLDHLVNLEWLDLSFNNIQVMEGLDSLVNLKDLSFFNNKIKKIEGIDNLSKLEILSIGNNQISTLDNLTYLRRLKNLQVMNINNNPVCNDPEWKSTILAYVKKISHLNYRLVTEIDIAAAKETFQDELLELEAKEAALEVAEEEKLKKEENVTLLKTANYQDIESLYEFLFDDDSEFKKLTTFIIMAEPLKIYKEKLETANVDFKKFILQNHQRKKNENNEFHVAEEELKKESNDESLKMISKFNSKKKLVLRQINAGLYDPQTENEHLQQLRNDCDDLNNNLMDCEMLLVEQFEDMVREFERNLTEIHSSNMETIQSFFGRVRDLEKEFHSISTSLILNEWEKYHKGNQETDPNVNDEIKTLLLDKDTLVNLLNGCHDTRTSKIDAKEDDMSSREQKGMDDTLALAKKTEIERNRDRVTEIWACCERAKGDLDDYVL